MLTSLTPKAIDFSLEKIGAISAHAPKERLPKEEQIRCALYHFFEMNGVFAIPEAGYYDAEHGDKSECDLRLIYTQQQMAEEWVEIKTARKAPGFQTKLKEEVARWQVDGWKVEERAPLDATKTFLLYIFSDEHPDESEHGFFKEIRELWEADGYPASQSKTVALSWRGSSIRYVTAWSWQWSPDGSPINVVA